MKDSMLRDLLDWDTLKKLEPCAGGHDDYMKSLFKGATVLAHWNEGDYQGEVATAVQLADGRYCWYQDSYGSCSGCDSWEDAAWDDVQELCKGLASDAEVFATKEEMLADMLRPRAESWKSDAGSNLHKLLAA